ncbi:MAG: quinolinate synthase NadA, partial [Gammaproteobacteria bacterium]
MSRLIDYRLHDGRACAVSRHAMPHAGLEYTPAVAQRTAGLYDLVRHVIPAVEWPAIAPLVDDIQRLKRERNAVVLAHNYMTSDIYFCVGDF